PRFFEDCKDVLALARHLFKPTGPKEVGFFKLEFHAPLLGINIVKAHDASSDVLATWEAFKKYTKGIELAKAKKELRTLHPVLSLGQTIKDEGRFNPEKVVERYQIACLITHDLAEKQFGLENTDFYKQKNLAAILDIDVGKKDPVNFINWRIF